MFPPPFSSFAALLSWLLKLTRTVWCMRKRHDCPQARRTTPFAAASATPQRVNQPQQMLSCKRGALPQSCWKESLLQIVEKGVQVLCRAQSRAQVTSNSHWKDDWFCSILLLPAKHCRMFSLLLASKFAAFVCQVLGLSNEHELPLMVHTYFPCAANPPFH